MVQNSFRLKMHQNNIFLFFKKNILTLAHQNNLKKNNFKQKQIKFLGTRFQPRFQTLLISNSIH